jgi:hypothetical protein
MANVNYSQVSNMVEVVKNFYQECDEVRARTEAEVMQWRTDNQVGCPRSKVLVSDFLEMTEVNSEILRIKKLALWFCSF